MEENSVFTGMAALTQVLRNQPRSVPEDQLVTYLREVRDAQKAIMDTLLLRCVADSARWDAIKYAASLRYYWPAGLNVLVERMVYRPGFVYRVRSTGSRRRLAEIFAAIRLCKSSTALVSLLKQLRRFSLTQNETIDLQAVIKGVTPLPLTDPAHQKYTARRA